MAVVLIQPAGPESSESVWAMLQRFATSYTPSRETFDRDFPPLLKGDGDLLIAKRDEAPVGYPLAHRTLTLFAGGPILQIVELYVEEAQRGEGVGQSLVKAALERAWTEGCVEAVVPTRRAGAFYQRLGFEPTAELLKLRRPRSKVPLPFQ